MKFISVVFLVVLAHVGVEATCGRAESTLPLPVTLPVPVSGAAWQPLQHTWNTRFQAELDAALHGNALWRSLIASGKMAVGLVDLSNPKSPRFARVNGNVMMYGASLPKLAILLAAFQGFEDGILHDTPEVQADLMEMIRRSGNAAASRMITRLGLKEIGALLTDPRYHFYDAAQGGGLWLGRWYAPGGESNPEPLKGLIHAATVFQLCRFYYALAYGRIIGPERSSQMLDVLAFPDLHDKFVQVLEQSVPPQHLHRKSGQWKIWHSDSVLVWDESWRRYILACLVEDERGEQVLRDLVPVVERLLSKNRSVQRAAAEGSG